MFEKGKSGNPAGRPKGARGGYSASSIIASMEIEKEPGVSRSQWLTDKLWFMVDGDNTQEKLFAIKTLIEYDSGKPSQPIEHTGSMGDSVDMSKLSKKELSAFKKLQEKVIVQNITTDNADNSTNISG